MKLALRVREPFHLEGRLLERGQLLTDEQSAHVRKLSEKHGHHELLRRCTQEAIDEPAQAETPQTESAPAPEVERRKRNTPRDQQE